MPALKITALGGDIVRFSAFTRIIFISWAKFERMMNSREMTILNEYGLHARPAAKIVQLAAKHSADVFITYNNNRVNAKSIMGLMMLAVEKGGKILLEVDGEDEDILMDKLIELITQGFGEL